MNGRKVSESKSNIKFLILHTEDKWVFLTRLMTSSRNSHLNQLILLTITWKFIFAFKNTLRRAAGSTLIKILLQIFSHLRFYFKDFTKVIWLLLTATSIYGLTRMLLVANFAIQNDAKIPQNN